MGRFLISAAAWLAHGSCVVTGAACGALAGAVTAVVLCSSGWLPLVCITLTVMGLALGTTGLVLGRRGHRRYMEAAGKMMARSLAGTADNPGLG